MNSLDKAIAYAFPGWAAKRQQARRMLALYSAGQSRGRLSTAKLTDNGDADSAVGRAGQSMAQQARELEQNYDVVKGALDIFEGRLIGTSLQTEPQVKRRDGTPHTELNAQIKTWYLRWLEHLDISATLPGGALQRLCVRAWLRDGEFLCRLLEGRQYPHNGLIPFSLELLESDQLPFYDGHHNGNRIIQGVEKNAFKRPVAYHLLKEHPGAWWRANHQETLRIPAAAIRHLTLLERFGQTRGVSALHATFGRLDDVRDYDDSERIAAKMAAALGAQIVRDPTVLADPVNYPESGKRRFGFKPGMFWDNLAPGEKIEMINANGRPNAQLDAFRRGQLRMAARAMWLSHGDFTGEHLGSYSSERMGQEITRMNMAVLADSFVRRFWHSVYKELVNVLIVHEFVDLPRDVDQHSLHDAVHRSPAMPYIDPMKEAKAKAILLEFGLESRSNLIRQSGRNPDEVDAEIARDQNRAEELGIVLPGSSTKQTAESENDSAEQQDNEQAGDNSQWT